METKEQELMIGMKETRMILMEYKELDLMNEIYGIRFDEWIIRN